MKSFLIPEGKRTTSAWNWPQRYGFKSIRRCPKLKIQASCAPPPCGITLPSKQDVFVGFATVPGFVSFTSEDGSPYLQVGFTCTLHRSTFTKALAQELAERHATADLSDIHLLVKVTSCKSHLCLIAIKYVSPEEACYDEVGWGGSEARSWGKKQPTLKIAFQQVKHSQPFQLAAKSQLFQLAGNFELSQSAGNVHNSWEKLLLQVPGSVQGFSEWEG